MEGATGGRDSVRRVRFAARLISSASGAGGIPVLRFAAYLAGALVHRRRKSGNVCSSARLTFIFSCSPSRPGSASIGAWGEGATLLFLFSLSGALEHYALGRTQREIRSLFRDAPKVATVLDEQGHEREVPVEQLRPGMRLLIKPGAQFPVDAEIVKGADRRRRIQSHRRSHAGGEKPSATRSWPARSISGARSK